tara:strand:- start:6432 stop:6632 length:201 start_codon:yes stop_codon:yes gene_type:complete
MRFVGKEVAVLTKMYGCDCCSKWMVSGDTAVILCYKVISALTVEDEDSFSSLTFVWECPECSGVSV